jgi:hypothetical protein
MAALAFILSGAAMWAHFELIGPAVVSGVPILRVWPIWYAIVLAVACWTMIHRKDDGAWPVSATLIGSFLAAHFVANFSSMVIPTQAIRFISVAAILMMIGIAFPRWQIFAAAGLHLAIVAFGFAADNGFIFGGKRPMQFIAWSYPDVSAGLQHAALLVLSLRNREHQGASVEHHSGYGGLRGVFGMAALALRKIAR